MLWYEVIFRLSIHCLTCVNADAQFQTSVVIVRYQHLSHTRP